MSSYNEHKVSTPGDEKVSADRGAGLRRRLSAGGVLVVGATLAAGLTTPAGAAAPVAKVPSWPSVVSLMPQFMQANATRSTSELSARIDRKLTKRIKKAALGSDVTMRVEDLSSGKKLWAKKGNQAQVPASTMKLATALAVLSVRKDSYTLKTTVRRAPGSRDITLIGGGDPLLSSGNLDELAKSTAQAVRAQGLPEKKLRLNYDASLFSWASLPSGWPSSYFSNYVARPSALSRDRRKVGDPAKDAAVYFRDRLYVHGLKKGDLRGKVYQNAPEAGASVVASYDGHDVGDALWRMLRYSDNSVAELMIRHVALARGEATTSTGSANAVQAQLRLLDVPVKKSVFIDGSGLSRNNRLTAKTLTGILRASFSPQKTHLSSPYRNWSLPIAGQSGTLSTRFKSSRTRCANGLVVAKTGTLTGVIALSGVAVGDDGRHRAFSVLVNNRPSGRSVTETRERVDQLATTLTGCK
ncbi:MAG: D-alanyl-D-alanine carboxypeptidase/D-alanyl-D-alanine-endopeptidase [Actinomycetia bacterium]|nr:D-alanyl-D-alanine carboxypeptidase/D-alanyl-D-alanine-endopeptidase [Actinomycetes bacterium]